MPELIDLAARATGARPEGAGSTSRRGLRGRLSRRGGEDGLDFYRSITEKWTAALRVGGRLLFEVGIGQADEVLRIMRSVGFGDLEITPDLNGIPRVVEGVLHKEL